MPRIAFHKSIGKSGNLKVTHMNKAKSSPPISSGKPSNESGEKNKLEANKESTNKINNI